MGRPRCCRLGEPPRCWKRFQSRNRGIEYRRENPRRNLRELMSRPLRILMTADTVGGVWTYALELVRALDAYGVQVALAPMGVLPSGFQRRQASAVPNLELFESAYKLEWMEDPWMDVAAAGDWLLALEQRVE